MTSFHPIAVMQRMVDQALSDHTYIAVVTAVSVVSGVTLYAVQRATQQTPDPTAYVAYASAGTLAVGDIVSLIQHGASYVIGGKIASGVAAVGQNPVAPPAPAGGAYLGVWQPDPAVDGNLASVLQFETDAGGKKQAIIAFWRDWAASGTIPASTLSQIAAHGSTPFVTWNPTDFSGVIPQSTFALSNITAGSFDSYLTAQAHTLANFGKPVFVRIMHEMNGMWEPWSGDPNAYVQAWRQIWQVVKSIAPLALFVWCPNVWALGGTGAVDPQAYYPGDAYVDWVGMDGYNSERRFGSWQTFSQIFGFTYGQLLSAHSKPLMICETGCDDDPRKAAWFTDAFGTAIPSFFPLLKGFLYFNESTVASEGLGSNWPIESDAAAKSAYAAGVAAAYYLSTVG